MSSIQILIGRAQDLERSIDKWNDAYMVLVALAVVLAAGVFLAQFVVIRKGRLLNSIQGQVSKEKDLQIAQAQAETAKAQLALSQTLRSFARRVGDRVLNFSTFVESLNNHPAKTVEVWYKPDDIEAERFSDDICRALQSIGWPVSARALKPDDRLGGMSVAKQQGILVLSRHIEDGSPFSMLILKALLFGGGGTATTARELPENKLVIVVGTRDKI